MKQIIDDQILNEQEACAFLHQKNPRTLRLWRKTRGLPHYAPTRKVILYRKSDLVAWLEQSRTATIGGRA
jgi:hypothetical protein